MVNANRHRSGVPNPYTVHVHPYPTRYHGAIYTRPVFNMPYRRTPHAVFKPDDFYSFYGVSGVGNYGSLGSNILGLGATGQPIYWMDAKTNPKVTTLQEGINKVLVANGYAPIKVTGKLEGTTCGALAVCLNAHKPELLSQVPEDIVGEAANTCRLAHENDAVFYAPKKDPNASQVQQDPAPPPPPPPEETPDSPAVVKPVEQEPKAVTPAVTDIPEMEIPGDSPQTDRAKAFPWLTVALVAGGAGVLWYMFRKK